MFRSDEQIARVNQALCRRVRLGGMWTDSGPTDRAVEYIEKGNPLSSGENVMLHITFALWSGHSDLPFARLIQTLDGDHLIAVGRLLVAIAQGARAVDEWLDDQQAERCGGCGGHAHTVVRDNGSRVAECTHGCGWSSFRPPEGWSQRPPLTRPKGGGQ
jgi:hypothetical protein